jgi:hypothetical protein
MGTIHLEESDEPLARRFIVRRLPNAIPDASSPAVAKRTAAAFPGGKWCESPLTKDEEQPHWKVRQRPSEALPGNFGISGEVAGTGGKFVRWRTRKEKTVESVYSADPASFPGISRTLPTLQLDQLYGFVVAGQRQFVTQLALFAKCGLS